MHKMSFTKEPNREEWVRIEKLNVNCAPSGPEGKWLNLTKLIKNMTESHFTLK